MNSLFKSQLKDALIRYVEARGHKETPINESCGANTVISSGLLGGETYPCTCGYDELIKLLEEW